MTEVWKDIPGYEGFYQASSLGRIRSLDRTVKYKDGREGFVFGRILKSSPGTHGYPMVDVSRDGKRRHVGIHILVALTFHGPKPPDLEVCHRDGNRLNAAKDNLRYDTRSNNQMDRVEHGTHNRGEQNGGCKLREDDVVEIRRLLKTGKTQREIASQFGIAQQTVYAIGRGLRWSWLHV